MNNWVISISDWLRQYIINSGSLSGEELIAKFVFVSSTYR